MKRNKYKKKYIEYLMSAKWRKLRKEKAEEQNYTCEMCGKVVLKGFHIHHKSYKHLGNEDLAELMFLCEPCHKKIHAGLKKETPLQGADCMYAEQYISFGTKKKKKLVYCVKKDTKCEGVCNKYKAKTPKKSRTKCNILKIFRKNA